MANDDKTIVFCSHWGPHAYKMVLYWNHPHPLNFVRVQLTLGTTSLESRMWKHHWWQFGPVMQLTDTHYGWLINARIYCLSRELSWILGGWAGWRVVVGGGVTCSITVIWALRRIKSSEIHFCPTYRSGYQQRKHQISATGLLCDGNSFISNMRKEFQCHEHERENSLSGCIIFFN